MVRCTLVIGERVGISREGERERAAKFTRVRLRPSNGFMRIDASIAIQTRVYRLSRAAPNGLCIYSCALSLASVLAICCAYIREYNEGSVRLLENRVVLRTYRFSTPFAACYMRER